MSFRSTVAVVKRSRFTDAQIVRIVLEADEDLVVEVAKRSKGEQAIDLRVAQEVWRSGYG